MMSRVNVKLLHCNISSSCWSVNVLKSNEEQDTATNLSLQSYSFYLRPASTEEKHHTMDNGASYFYAITCNLTN